MSKKPFWKKYTLGEMFKLGLFQLLIGIFIFMPVGILIMVVGSFWLIGNIPNLAIPSFATLGAVIFFAFVQFIWMEMIRDSLDSSNPKDREIYIKDKKRRDSIILKL